MQEAGIRGPPPEHGDNRERAADLCQEPQRGQLLATLAAVERFNQESLRDCR